MWQPNAVHSAQRASSAILATRKVLSRRMQPLTDATNIKSLPSSVGAVRKGPTTSTLTEGFPTAAAAPRRLLHNLSSSTGQQVYASPFISSTTAEAAPLATPDSAFMALCAIPLVQVTPLSVAGHSASNFPVDLLTSQSSFPSDLLGSGLGSPLGSPPDSFDRSLLMGTWGQDLNVTGEDAVTGSAALAGLSLIDSAPQIEQLDKVDADCSAMVAAAIGL